MNESKKTKTAKILYRTKRYGKWQPASISVPVEEKNVRDYCFTDLQKLGISPVAITVQKVIL